MEKSFFSTPEGQKKLCYSASHTAVISMQRKAVEKLQAERFQLVKAWRSGGQTPELWAKVEAHDSIQDKQEQILSDLLDQ